MHAHKCACASTRAFTESPQTYVVILRQQNIGRKKTHAHSTPSDYVFSCPCNKETPKTRKPLREGDNQTDSSITQVMQEETDQVIPFLPTRHNLGENISRIVNRRHMPND
jgi:hypothetical protein